MFAYIHHPSVNQPPPPPPPPTQQQGLAFFPPAEEEAQLIEAFAVFAGAFVVRPLGGIIFGWIGDRRSKQFSLQLSLFLMALSTTLIVRIPATDTDWASRHP